jgi:hypothetical protein
MEPEKAEALPTSDRIQSELILIGDKVMAIYYLYSFFGDW